MSLIKFYKLLFLNLLVFFCVANLQITVASTMPILNILAPTQFLHNDLIQEFSDRYKIQARVEFYLVPSEIEARLKSGHRLFDIIITDEKTLEKLSLVRSIRSLPETIFSKFKLNPQSFPLAKITPLNEEGRFFLPLVADPLGIIYSTSTLTRPKNEVDWSWLANPEQNNLWRQKIFISSTPLKLYLYAQLAAHQPLQLQNNNTRAPDSLKTLKALANQNVPISMPLSNALVSKTIHVSPMYLSQFRRFNQPVIDFDFTIPKPFTYYRRFSIAVATDSYQEIAALKFVNHLMENRDRLTKLHNFISIKEKNYMGLQTAGWILDPDISLLPKNLESQLTKVLNGN